MVVLRLFENEIKVFRTLGKDAGKLLTINLIYAIAFPFILIFGTAFVRRITAGDNFLSIVYNWGFFLGLVAGYYLTGTVLKKRLIDIKWLFSVGILLAVMPLTILMNFASHTGFFVIFYGILIGWGNGIYWSCRNFLTYLVTSENNRNFYASVEQFIIISCNAIIPLVFGAFVLGSQDTDYQKIEAYKYTSILILAINLVACGLILRSDFKTPIIKRFTYSQFCKSWNFHRLTTFLVGTVESGFIVLMILLILTLAGDESVLGKIEFATAIFSVITIYIVGRVSKPRHRGHIMLAGALSLIVGSIVLSFTIQSDSIMFGTITVSFIGIIIMKIMQVIADPLIHSSYRASYLSNIEKASRLENKDSYAFVMDNEYFMNGGRIFGGLIFIAISTSSSQIMALKYTFLILALLQLLSALLVFISNKDIK